MLANSDVSKMREPVLFKARPEDFMYGLMPMFIYPRK